MTITHNYLRMYRKRSRLAQADIASILRLSDYSNISRWEKGQRKPSIELLILYNVLFDIPIEALFERQRDELRGAIGDRLRARVGELRLLKPTRRVESRIAFLTDALERLTANPS